MRSIQEVFNLAIAHAGYPEVNGYMCSAVAVLRRDNRISVEERDSTWYSIDDYLEPAKSVFLEWALRAKGLPSTPNDRLAIYKDWANRPKLSAE